MTRVSVPFFIEVSLPKHFLRATLRITAAGAAIAFAALAAGCGSDSPTTPPNSSNSLDLTSVFAQISSADASSLASARGMLGVPALVVPTAVPSSCSFSSSTQGFVCPPKTTAGLTVGFTYYLYDAAGHSLNAADATTTDGVRTVADVKGTVTTQFNSLNATMKVDDHSDMTLKGLLSTSRTLNGTATSHLDLTTTGTASTHSVIDLATTTANVVLPKAAGSWPASGTITSDGTTKTDVGANSVTLDLHQVLTFNGTSIVTVATTVAGHSSTCKIDLSGRTAPVC